ncbi:transglycosylase domain-containing protein [Streptomyces sp. H27-D2]|uniref:transglycosylase domain-containing protein n=1 Tax=Streptomyces sp. H27-D2 TaxID=3046304 RepID=UPI002DB9D223|nr:transglycosylase domain-containing protein [Streptomyces sp. H27-D2]MEC4019567.1 transglycosylase domain-containing protein [Streptomyces sp. H27-D2]
MRWHYPRPGRRGFRRWLPSWQQWLTVVLTGAVGLGTLVGYAYWQAEIPKNLNSFATQQNNIYYWADGSEMARSGWVSRQEMPLEKVPQDVRWAVLAAENETFYSDYGVSPSGIARAALRMGAGGDTQGGSTITQQYVKNAYLNQDQTLSRKFTEMLISVKLDNRMSKREILQGYLNTSWFGRGTYGIQRAAQAYYGKEVSELDASEGAFLASLLKGAALYDPTVSDANRRRAEERWDWTLDRMVKIGKLSAKERAGFTVFPTPKAAPKATGLSGQSGYLMGMAKAYLGKHTRIPDAEFDRGGYQIYTTFEKPRVEALSKAVRKVRADLDPDKRSTDRYVRVGAASVAPDGRVLAVHGGEDYLRQGSNDANAVNVPAGTAFTPFVYAAALREGVQKKRGAARVPVSPGTPYDGDDKVSVKTPEGPYWDRSGKIVKVSNDGGRSWGRISLREAMVHSVNTPLIQLGMDVGLEGVRRTARDAGLLEASFGPQVPAFSLGNSTPSALRMAGAYGTFAAGGLHTEPYSVLRVTRNGAKIAMPRPPADRALSPQVAARVTDALRGAVQTPDGHAAAARAVGPGAAGKSGTEPDNKSAWFAGYTAQESTAVALFRLEPKTLELLPLNGLGGGSRSAAGSRYPIQIWTDYMKAGAR